MTRRLGAALPAAQSASAPEPAGARISIVSGVSVLQVGFADSALIRIAPEAAHENEIRDLLCLVVTVGEPAKQSVPS